MTREMAVTWYPDEQQVSFINRVFDLTLHEPIDVGLSDIDELASLSVGQNREEMTLDAETVDIIVMYLQDGSAMPMPVVWKKDLRARKVVALDGRHRIEGALRKLELPTVPCLLVTGDTLVAQNFATVVNTMHGRSVRSAEYTAQSMRLLRDRNVPVAQIARMFGVSDERVYVMTRRDEAAERVRALVPDRTSRVPYHTLDMLSQLEDEHVRILGQLFLDATKSQQLDIVNRIKQAPSAMRDQLAHEAVGELRALDEARRKVKARASRPSSQLQDALSRLRRITDPLTAYHQSTDPQKAVMRSNLAEVMPRLNRLWSALTEDRAGAA